MPSVQPGPTSATIEPATSAPPHVLSVFARVVRARLRALVVIALVVAAAVMLGWAAWPTKYKAVALVALDPQAPRLLTDQAAAGNGDASAVVSLAEVASSDGFLIPIVKDQKLAEDPEFVGGGGGMGDVLIELRRNLKVSRLGLSYLIDVSFTSKDPSKAARVANAVADEIVRRQQTQRREANAGLSDALRSRLADLRAAVLASEKAVADYRQKNDLLDVSPDGRVGLKRLNSLADQLGPIRARLEDARARWDKLRKAGSAEDADPSIFRSDRLTELLSRLGDEKRQLASAAQTYGPRHPAVAAGQARIASLETAIRAERARIVDQAKAEVDVLIEQNAAYEKEIAKRTSEQLATDQKEVVLQDLVRQAQADRQIYEQFLTRQKATQEQGDMSQPDAVVVSSASPPTRPTRPGLTSTALIALLGGLGTGLMWVLFGPRPPPRRLAAPSPASAAAPTEPVVPPSEPPAPPPAASSPVVASSPTVAPIADVAVSQVPPSSAVIAPSPAVDRPPEAAPPPAANEPVAAAVVPDRAAAAPPRAEPTEPPSPPTAAPAPPPPPVRMPEGLPDLEPRFARPMPRPAPADGPLPIVVEPVATPSPIIAPPPLPEVATPAEAAASAPPQVAAEVAPRMSPRRHDPVPRLKRMLRVLTEHDVPLVADLTRPDPTDAEAGLAAFVDTVAAHLDRTPGLVLTVVGEPEAPLGVAEALAAAIAARGHPARVHDGLDPAAPSAPDGFVVESLAATDTPPPSGAHPFALLVVEASRASEERLPDLIDLWESDPDRVLVAAFVPAAPGD